MGNPQSLDQFTHEEVHPQETDDTLDFDTSFEDALSPDADFAVKLDAPRELELPPTSPEEPGNDYTEFMLEIDEGDDTADKPGPLPAADADAETPADAEEATVPESPRSVFPDADADVFTIMEIEPESAFASPADEEPATAQPTPPAARAALDALPERSSGTPWVTGLLAGVLIALLIAQIGLFYRNELVQAMPGLRPFIETLCANIGCSMDLPRDPQKISIEASDLNRLPDQEGVFVLSATLTNRADVAQAYPHLELTLTDANDRPLIRKVLSPRQWLGAIPGDEGFAAGSTREVEVNFSANNVNAAGYRLYAFYP